MTIGTGDTRIVVSGAGCIVFIVRMLCLEHRSASIRIFPIFESRFFIIGKDFFDLCAVVPWESEIFAIAFEIIFDVAVRANNASHFLAGEGCPILALAFKGFLERGVGHDQAHGACFVAVGAAD